jgi:hypothetical protein
MECFGDGIHGLEAQLKDFLSPLMNRYSIDFSMMSRGVIEELSIGDHDKIIKIISQGLELLN